jgi:alcohol dehydrogenase (cytochrome c)
MLSAVFGLVVVFMLASLLPRLVAVAEEEAVVVTTRDGVYTTEQAESARSLYQRECADCHGNNLGGTANAPSLLGFAFQSYWNGRTMGELFTYTKTMMPLTAPGSLSGAQVTNLLALILLENGFEAGEEPLPVELELLEAIVYAEPEKPAP